MKIKDKLYALEAYLPFGFKRFFNLCVWKCKFKNVMFRGGTFFHLADILEGRVNIGEYSYIWPNSRFYAWKDKISIWKYCAISDHFYAITYNYSMEYITCHLDQRQDAKLNLNHEAKHGSIEIWHDVWIGHNCTVLPGVKIWNWSIIWAGSIVTKDIPAYAIACGNPAKVIKYRFPPEKMEFVEKLKWWDWDAKELKENEKLLDTNIKNTDLKELEKFIKG